MKHPGPVEKLQMLAAAAGLSHLTRTELACLVILADMANAETGLAWPSFATLAQRTGSDLRHVKRAMKRLIAMSLVVVAQPGTRTRSNRYRINARVLESMGSVLDATTGSGAQDTTQGSGADTTTVVAYTPPGSGVDGQKVVACTPPESIHQSKMESEIDGGSQAEAAADGLRAYGASALRPAGDRFPEFWDAIGRRTTVKDAEQRIAEAIADGADYGDIVAGARRYRAYCDRTGWKKARAASAWIESEGWRDDWTPPPKAEPKPKPEPELREATREERWSDPENTFCEALIELEKALVSELGREWCQREDYSTAWDDVCEDAKAGDPACREAVAEHADWERKNKPSREDFENYYRERGLIIPDVFMLD